MQELTGNTKFLSTDPFRNAVRTFLPQEKKLKPLEHSLNQYLAQVPQNPSFEFLKAVEYLICERRLWRRYLRSRFGLRQLNRVKLPSALYERVLCESALKSFRLVEIQFYCYLYIILLVAAKWKERSPFNLQEFFAEVLCLVGRAVLQDIRLFMLAQDLSFNQEHGDSGDVELANLAAWAACNARHSPRVIQALEAEGEESASEAMLNRVPSAIFLALQEKEPQEPFSAGSGGASVLSRVESIIAEDTPLEGYHEALRQGRLRKAAEKEGGDNNAQELSPFPVVKPEDLADLHAKDFILREEARDAIQKAGLTPDQMEIYLLDLEGLTDEEIAQHSSKAVGTVKAHLHKARKKVKEVWERP